MGLQDSQEDLTCATVMMKHDDDEEDGRVKGEDGRVKGEGGVPRPSVNARLLIVCEDGMLSCTAALSLLLSHYHTTIDFNTHLPCLPKAVSASTSGRDRGRGRQAVSTPFKSKDEIKTCLSALQMHVPFADQLPRRLVKELNMFFTSTSISTSTYTRKLKH